MNLYLHLCILQTLLSTVHSGYTFFVSMCVPWELNPQPFAPLIQFSATEQQEHYMGFTFWNEWQKILTFFMIFKLFFLDVPVYTNHGATIWSHFWNIITI